MVTQSTASVYGEGNSGHAGMEGVTKTRAEPRSLGRAELPFNPGTSRFPGSEHVPSVQVTVSWPFL